MAKDNSPLNSPPHTESLQVSPERRATYLARRGDDLNQLLVAFQNADTSTVCAIAHRIKGSARLFGFESLEALMIRIEILCKDNNNPDLTTELNEFKNILDQALNTAPTP